MNVGWQRRSLRVRLAAWYGGAGVAVLVVCLMAALISGVWVPVTRSDVLIVLFVGLERVTNVGDVSF